MPSEKIWAIIPAAAPGAIPVKMITGLVGKSTEALRADPIRAGSVMIPKRTNMVMTFLLKSFISFPPLLKVDAYQANVNAKAHPLFLQSLLLSCVTRQIL